MPTYTVHQPPLRAAETVPDPERFVFVHDGFYVWAFLLTPLWMLVHRLWLVLVCYLVASVALGAGLYLIDAAPSARVLIALLIGLLAGFEGATLRRWTLARRGWRSAGFVVAEDDELAERRYFSAWDGTAAAPSPPANLTTPVPPRTVPDVIGLFPQPGAPR